MGDKKPLTVAIGAAGALAMLAAEERRRSNPLEIQLDDPFDLLPNPLHFGGVETVNASRSGKDRSKVKAARKQSRKDRKKR